MDKSSNTNIFAKLFFGAIAIWVVPLYQGGKYLLEKALDGLWGGLLAFFIGLPLSIVGGIVAGNWVGWQKYPAVTSWFQSWMPGFLSGISNFLLHYGWCVIGVLAGALAFWVLFAYGWSITYLVFVKPVTKAADKVRRFFDDEARKHYAKLETGFLTARSESKNSFCVRRNSLLRCGSCWAERAGAAGLCLEMCDGLDTSARAITIGSTARHEWCSTSIASPWLMLDFRRPRGCSRRREQARA